MKQPICASLMWICVTFIYLVPAVVATIRLLSPAPAFEGRYPQAEVDQQEPGAAGR